MRQTEKKSTKGKSYLLWVLCLPAASGLGLLSCLEGGGLWLDENGYCQPVNVWAYAECPELCDSTNEKHYCYCDPKDPNGPCPCDMTDPAKDCYDSCKQLEVNPETGVKSWKNTCKNTNEPINDSIDCPKDPLNPCTPECESLRTIDYTTQIAPIWANNACVASCHTRGSTGFNSTGHAKNFKVVQNGKDTVIKRGLSYQPNLNAVSMMVNVPMFSDSGNPNVPFWRIKPFYPDSSYLVTILSGPNGNFKQMPSDKPPIPPNSLADIKKWILEGACPSL